MTEIDSAQVDYVMRWALQNSCALELKGEVGFGRPCVGIVASGGYLDFMWHEMDYKNPSRPELWIPEDAYHKHPCMAVLVDDADYGKAFSQLYEWVKWCDENGWGCVVGPRKTMNEPGTLGANMELMMHGFMKAELRPL